jgi:hypothetical protein
LTQPGQKWGQPPLALIPAALADRLANIPLPDWLAQLLGTPGCTAGDLTAEAWKRLTYDETVSESIRKFVLEIVAEHASELRDVPIADGVSGGIDALGLEQWPTRARTALLRSSIGRDPNQLASLTFGEVLDAPYIGPRTALETAALLELYVPFGVTRSSTREAGRLPINAVIRWGEQGAPLLPQTLRRFFNAVSLPSWIQEDLHLPPGATALALDASVWRHQETLPPRVERYVLGLVTSRIDSIRDVRVTEEPWPSDVRPDAVQWPTRVKNALLSAGLLEPGRLEQLTYGELLTVPALGIKSALEFAVIADAMVTSSPPVAIDAAARQALATAEDEEWGERVSANDPRFRDVVPPYDGSLDRLMEDALNNPEGVRAHKLAEALPRIRTRAEEIASEPIDVALVRLVRSLGVSDRNAEITVARQGWDGGGPRTLQEVGDEYDVTRERVRQIVDKILERMNHEYLPQIEQAIEVLVDCSPIGVRDAAQLLVDRGLSTVPFDPISLKGAAVVLGYDVPFEIDPGEAGPVVIARGLGGTRTVFNVARRQVGRVGVSNVDEVRAELEVRGEDYTIDTVIGVLRCSAAVQFLDEAWFWIPSIPPERNRLRNVSRRMLSVTSRLSVTTLRLGVRRYYPFRHIDVVPPIGVLAAYYAAHPQFAVDNDGVVSPVEPLDYRHVLGDAEQIFVEALRTTKTGLMDRAEFEQVAIERGMNANTFSVMTSYSPILDHPALNVWCLRGQTIDPAQLEALRAVSATRTARRRTLTYGWDEDGGLRLTVEIGNVNSLVVGIPADILRYVAGRSFAAETREGSAVGTIVVDDQSSNSWGYGPFLRRRGAEPGDTLTLRFDLVNETVMLSLGDDSQLIDEA